MKLYYIPGSCSLSPHILLREAGLPFELVLASTKTHKLADGSDYYAINPKGSVPLLELDNGERLTEGPVIGQYIADLAPASGLAPANGTMARYRLQEWLNFLTSEVHKTFSPLFSPATPEDYKPIAKARIVDRLTLVDNALAGKSYLTGEQFTVADAYLVAMLNWCPFVGVDLGAWPKLAAYHKLPLARPAVAKAIAEEMAERARRAA